MSRQLSLFGKPVRVNSYFRNPVSEYEKFINKHGDEKGHEPSKSLWSWQISNGNNRQKSSMKIL